MLLGREFLKYFETKILLTREKRKNLILNSFSHVEKTLKQNTLTVFQRLKNSLADASI